MKKILILGLLLTLNRLKSQETASVEKQLFGVELGIFELGMTSESMLARKLVLHTELGITHGMSTRRYSDGSQETSTIFAPIISIEPRWYYGLDRRLRKGKNIKNNSSNYFSLDISYIGFNMPISKNAPFGIVPAITVIPTYGIRRSFAKQFYYEFDFGYGYGYNVFEKNECHCTHNYSYYKFNASIGYNF